MNYSVTPRHGGYPWPYDGPAMLRDAAEKTSWNSSERLLLEGGKRNGTTPATMKQITLANGAYDGCQEHAGPPDRRTSRHLSCGKAAYPRAAENGAGRFQRAAQAGFHSA